MGNHSTTQRWTNILHSNMTEEAVLASSDSEMNDDISVNSKSLEDIALVELCGNSLACILRGNFIGEVLIAFEVIQAYQRGGYPSTLEQVNV